MGVKWIYLQGALEGALEEGLQTDCLCQSGFQPNRRSTHLAACITTILTGLCGHSPAVNTGTAVEGRLALASTSPSPALSLSLSSPACIPSAAATANNTLDRGAGD